MMLLIFSVSLLPAAPAAAVDAAALVGGSPEQDLVLSLLRRTVAGAVSAADGLAAHCRCCWLPRLLLLLRLLLL